MEQRNLHSRMCKWTDSNTKINKEDDEGLKTTTKMEITYNVDEHKFPASLFTALEKPHPQIKHTVVNLSVCFNGVMLITNF